MMTKKIKIKWGKKPTNYKQINKSGFLENGFWRIPILPKIEDMEKKNRPNFSIKIVRIRFPWWHSG